MAREQVDKANGAERQALVGDGELVNALEERADVGEEAGGLRHWEHGALLKVAKQRVHHPQLKGLGVGQLGSAFGVTLEEAMARAHVIDGDGTLRTGISGFTYVWAKLPYWKYLAWMLQTVPLATSVAEAAYGVWAGARQHLQAGASGARSGEPLAARASMGASCRYVPGQKGPPPECR